MIARLVIATALTIGLVAAPAAADSVLNVQQSGPQERVTGPTADGKARRYFAQVNGTCEDSICTVKFGKKAGKIRTIETLSCVLTANAAGLLAGVNMSEIPDEIEFFMAPVSNVESGGTFFAVFERTKTFSVPESIPFIVLGQSSGDAGAMVCSAVGTITTIK